MHSFYLFLWIFFIYSFLGWCLEVCFFALNTGKFVNRGFLNGPVCPIYGFGVVIVVLCLTPLMENTLLLFLGSVLLTSLLELGVGFALEKLFHQRWWDYTNEPFNLGGYICLRFSLVWGVGALLVVKLVHPAIAALVALVPRTAGAVLAVPVLALFICDLVITVLGIAHMNQDIGRIDDIVRAMRAGSDILAENIGDTALAVDRKVAGAKPAAAARLDIARAELLDSRRLVAMRLMRAFPHMRSTRYAEGFERIRQWAEEEKQKRAAGKAAARSEEREQ